MGRSLIGMLVAIIPGPKMAVPAWANLRLAHRAEASRCVGNSSSFPLAEVAAGYDSLGAVRSGDRNNTSQRWPMVVPQTLVRATE